VLLLAAVPVVAVLVWAGIGIMARDGADGNGAIGRSVAAFGFDLSDAKIDISRIVVGSEGRHYIQPLDSPAMIPASEVDRINDEQRRNYLVSDDRVIGVEIDGESRAYPLRMLDWHEVVNDEVSGVPILVAYNGLSDSAAVFDRRVGGDVLRDVRRFAASGLVYNSHHILYDVRDDGLDGGESLWIPLQRRAVTGAAARDDLTLTPVPCELVTWADWRPRHPQTLVLAPNPDPAREKYYKRRTYGHYSSSDRLEFAVEPLPPDRGSRPYKTPMIAVEVHGAWHAFAIPDLIGRADTNGVVVEQIGERDLRFHVNAQPPTAWVEFESGERPPAMYAFWFAWYAVAEAGDRK